MIARFAFRTPWTLYLAHGAIDPVRLQQGDLEVVIHPPQQADPSNSRFIVPLESPVTAPGFAVNGEPAFAADIWVVDVVSSRDFDRQKKPLDPLVEVALAPLNQQIARLRAVLRVGTIHPLSKNKTSYTVTYLDNDGSLVGDSPKRKSFMCQQIRATGLVRGHWEAAAELPTDFETPVWHLLLLRAAEMFEVDRGASIVMAYVALEVFSEHVADSLADAANLPEGLWDWICDRDHWSKNPGVADRLTHLLNAFTGHDIRQEAQRAWAAFKQLRDARNNFVHRGVVATGRPGKGKGLVPLNNQKAVEIFRGARSLVQWIEEFLPADSPRLPSQPEHQAIVTAAAWF